jgi:peptidoglycan glycosyltransferase
VAEARTLAHRRRTSDDAGPKPERAPYRSIELGLLLLAAFIITALQGLAGLGAKGHLPHSLWLFLGFVVGVSLVLHVAISFLAPYSSQVLLPLATLLNGIGYIEIARWNTAEARNLSAWVGISALALVFVLLVVRRIRDLDRYRYLTLLAAIVLMLLPIVPHIGRNVNGARLWVDLGPVSFQPIELAKILLAIFFASYFAANKEMLSYTSPRFAGRGFVSLRTIVPIIFAWVFAILVLGAENDIGFSILLFALFVAMIWVATGRYIYIGAGLALLAGGLYYGSKYFHQVHQRFAIWLDPWTAANWAHGGSQLGQGWFAIAAGGLTGTGVGLGQAGSLPALTRDMIFAAIAEEMGLIGVAIVIASFILFVAEGIHIAQRAHNDFARLAALALSLIVGLQAFIIIAGVLRVLPLTGITLPFVAYGGSSLVANYVIVALLLRISDENHRDVRGGEVRAIQLKPA